MNNGIEEMLCEIKDGISETPKRMFKYNKITFNLEECQLLLDYITNLQEENKRLNKTLDKIIQENIVVRDRLSKAIEYLTEEGVCIMNKGKKENERLVWDWQNYYELLNILRGEDDE